MSEFVVPGVHLEITKSEDGSALLRLSMVVDKKVDNVHDDTALGVGKIIERGNREADFAKMYNRVRKQVPYRNT